MDGLSWDIVEGLLRPPALHERMDIIGTGLQHFGSTCGLNHKGAVLQRDIVEVSDNARFIEWPASQHITEYCLLCRLK